MIGASDTPQSTGYTFRPRFNANTQVKHEISPQRARNFGLAEITAAAGHDSDTRRVLGAQRRDKLARARPPRSGPPACLETAAAAPAAKPITVTGITILRIVDGQIIEDRAETTIPSLRGQLEQP
jgi:hypothetical protein